MNSCVQIKYEKEGSTVIKDVAEGRAKYQEALRAYHKRTAALKKKYGHSRRVLYSGAHHIKLLGVEAWLKAAAEVLGLTKEEGSTAIKTVGEGRERYEGAYLKRTAEFEQKYGHSDRIRYGGSDYCYCIETEAWLKAAAEVLGLTKKEKKDIEEAIKAKL